MNISSRIRSWYLTESDKLRPMTWKQKISYLTTYYTRWFVLFLIICLFVSFIGDALIQSRKEIVLQGYFTNDDNNFFPGSKMEKEYAAVLDLKHFSPYALYDRAAAGETAHAAEPPQTGDASNVLLWAALAATSAAGMTLLARKRKKA